MSLSSLEFLALLPVVLLVYFGLTHNCSPRLGRVWLVVVSLAFYADSSAIFLPVLLASLVFNFLAARWISQTSDPTRKRRYLVIGLVANVLLLSVFKYSAFVAQNLSSLTGWQISVPSLGFPLGISFITLQQIMFLMDCYEGIAPPFNFLNHALFLTFFPYITAGPITRGNNIRSTVDSPDGGFANADNLAKGIFLFAIGRFKKVVIADRLGLLAGAGFDADGMLSTYEAWMSTLAYTFQMYFDFSGYSDMAIAVCLMLNFTIPHNFDSPLKSTSLIQFWSKWHITLSSFITTYIYTPLLKAQSQVTFARAMVITVVAMTISGLWHGPSWNFVFWGTLHGVGLVINQNWKRTKRKLPRFVAWLLTFMFVNVTLIWFRARSFGRAASILASMVSFRATQEDGAFAGFLLGDGIQIVAVSILAVLLCFFFRNSHQLVHTFKPTRWTLLFVVIIASVAIACSNDIATKGFIYRDF